MNEDTVFRTLALPNGRDWEFYEDVNVMVFAPHLGPEGRERAIREFQARWRRFALRTVRGLPSQQALAETQPMDVQPQASLSVVTP